MCCASGRPDRLPVPSGMEGQPGYRTALEVVNGRSPATVRANRLPSGERRSLRLPRWADGQAYDPL